MWDDCKTFKNLVISLRSDKNRVFVYLDNLSLAVDKHKDVPCVSGVSEALQELFVNLKKC